MAQREIKFRAWSPEINYMYYNVGLPLSLTDTKAEVMQFTGLQDKNGKEIYEGDIVKETLPLSKVVTNRVIEYKESASAFLLDGCLEFAHRLSDIEVVGNLYENKDLLNK